MCPCLSFYLYCCSCTISVRVCVCTVDAVPGAQWPLPAFLSGGRSQLFAGWWSPCTCSARPPSADARPLDTLTTEQHAYLLRRRRTGDIMCTHRCSSTHLNHIPWCAEYWAHPCSLCNSFSSRPALWPSLDAPARCIKFYIKYKTTNISYSINNSCF